MNSNDGDKDPKLDSYKQIKKDWNKINTVLVFDVLKKKEIEFCFKYVKEIGTGTFGIVCLIEDQETYQQYALKIVYQSRRHMNRELSVMKILKNSSIISLYKYFYTKNQLGDVYLNFILEYVPISLDVVLSDLNKTKLLKENLPCFLFQLFQALYYIHKKDICHRDIKPHNLLINFDKNILKLCDFGCAKILSKNEKNINYICARYYRAPEILFGSDRYNTKTDLWSVGCIMAEILLGKPLFYGRNTEEQIKQIVDVLGPPTKEDFSSMLCKERRFKKSKKIKGIPEEEIKLVEMDLLKKLLCYNPNERISAEESLQHYYFRNVNNKNK